ncbi:MAG: universal bacterial protein YeaZ [Paenibacillus sp.]|jgi:tRNA threonylcarbamoyladenosine biosynthesis protein TsaB|nr:universal bacterial protein YeaZ [Paenibacillus sp.]
MMKDIHAGPVRKLLAIDTSTGVLTVALSERKRIIAERQTHAERNHSIQLLPQIDAMLKEAGTAPSDLDAVAVGVGPGSYTGVRIGVTVAKTFAWSLGIPVVGVSSLEAMALGGASPGGKDGLSASSHKSTWYIPLLDARRKQAFCAVYAADSTGWRTIVGDGIRIVEDWLGTVCELAAQEQGAVTPGRLLFVGEPEGFRETIQAWSSSGGLTDIEAEVGIQESPMNAAAIAELAWRRLERGEQDDIHGLVPNYTQLAEAEVKLLQKQKQGGEPFGSA